MKERKISSDAIRKFEKYLSGEEKSNATIEKYVRDINAFATYLNGNALTKNGVIAYKQYLIEKGYASRSINSMLSSLNSLFRYMNWNDLRIKALKIQQQVFCPEEKELSRTEYERLCHVAQKQHNERLNLILQTICSTGIRVSELSYITVESVKRGQTSVSLKAKIRTVFLPVELRRKLMKYIVEQEIKTGPIFITRTGKIMSRSSIWREMKSLCEEAKVDPGKVFPHNLRHLFARVFYKVQKDIVKLADVLGHSSVNTTRLYIISTGIEHRRCIEHMRLII